MGRGRLLGGDDGGERGGDVEQVELAAAGVGGVDGDQAAARVGARVQVAARLVAGRLRGVEAAELDAGAGGHVVQVQLLGARPFARAVPFRGAEAG